MSLVCTQSKIQGCREVKRQRLLYLSPICPPPEVRILFHRVVCPMCLTRYRIHWIESPSLTRRLIT
jgi:hypothetical protein